MWRAVRLVVDTGIHAFSWSRDRAFDLRAFNDLLLAQGALPLDVLETLVRNWLERQVVAQDRQLP